MTHYLKVCDGCGVEIRLPDGPFGGNAQPDGWIATATWNRPDDPPALACSWACLGKVARARAKQDE